MTDALALYKQKRNFAVTPEPAAGGTPAAGALQYVVQKHWARQLHYDLRLELKGTMKSWAVPKGPSLDPADKRMAVQVEDHPLSYNRFEGQIPPGQYGAGKVIIWDRGYWVPEGDAAKAYRQGKLKFELHGHKLKGRWTLVRMHGHADERQPPWLLIKEHDAFEQPASAFSVVDAMPDSVSALPPAPAPNSRRAPARSKGSSVVRASAAATAQHLAQAPKARLPETLAPQLATLVDGPPADAADWLWELKFDGYRLLARKDRSRVRLLTRNGHDWTARMPQLAQALQQLPLQSGWIDGELLMLGANGVPDFQALQNAFDERKGGHGTQDLVYAVFDLPYADGRDLRAVPLVARRERLRTVIEAAPTDRLRFSEAFDAAPADLVASACKLGFEGVIGKRRSAAYVSQRNADWIKLKCRQRQEFVIGGFTDPQGSRAGLGSLLLGVHAPDGRLHYAGKVGTGFNAASLATLRRQLDGLRRRQSPFAEPEALVQAAAQTSAAKTTSAAPRVHWVQPKLLAEVSFAAWTQQARIRHAVFHGLRADKPAQAITREQAQPLAAAGQVAGTGARPASGRHASGRQPAAPAAAPRVSNPQRVIDAATGITKIELVQCYARLAPLMLAHLQDRPVALVRAPEGVKGEQFFQKHLAQSPMPGLQPLDPALDPDHAPLLVVTGREGLLAAAQMNVIEFHTWNARKDRIERPDRISFDLDPGSGVPWAQVQEAAQLLRVLLKELGLPAFLKTSGGKGLHVLVPIKRLHGWDTVKGFAQAVVQHLARTLPQRFVAKSGPRNRVGKIFVDYLRNGRGATTVCAWSARARPGLGVSVPVSWAELGTLTGGAHWTVRSVEERLHLGNTPWKAYDTAAVSIRAAMKRLGPAEKPAA